MFLEGFWLRLLRLDQTADQLSLWTPAYLARLRREKTRRGYMIWIADQIDQAAREHAERFPHGDWKEANDRLSFLWQLSQEFAGRGVAMGNRQRAQKLRFVAATSLLH